MAPASTLTAAARDALLRAADLLAAGAWEQAHAIVQDDPSVYGAWLHGIVHTLEGDLANARYWYRAADREFPGAEHARREIEAARREIAAAAPAA